jgi:integrase
VKIKDMMAEYIRLHCPSKKSGTKDIYRIKKYILPCLSHIEIDDLTPLDVQSWHQDIATQSGPYMANRVLEILRLAYNLAQDWELTDKRNPCNRVKRCREKSRKRYLTEAEIHRLLDSLSREDQLLETLVKLFLLTGLRKNELLKAHWSWINLETRTITIPETKNGEENVVALSPQALQLLLALPHNKPQIFPGKGKGNYVDINRAWLRIKTRAGLEDLRIHDLRRSVGCWLANNGETLLTIGRVLNHRSTASTAHYAHVAAETQRQALTKLADAIMPQAMPPDCTLDLSRADEATKH